jgi:hypothetical protein
MAAKTRTMPARKEKTVGAGTAGAPDRCELCRARLPDRFTARHGGFRFLLLPAFLGLLLLLSRH